MSTVAEIIKQAFREGNFIAVGEDPTTEETTEALPRLRNLVSSLFGSTIGEAYRDWFVPSDFSTTVPLRSPLAPASDVTVSGTLWNYPPPNSRLLIKTTAALTIYFPANPSDGARMQLVNVASSVVAITLDGNGHLVGGTATLVGDVDDLHGKQWMYRADLGDWVELKAVLEEADQMPLPAEFDDLFVCGLAMRLSTRFQTTVDAATSSRYADVLRLLKKRYKQTEGMPASYGELSSTVQQATAWDI